MNQTPPQPDAPHRPHDTAMVMPPVSTGLGPEPTPVTPSTPSFGVQMAQLVVIPALIVVACISLAVLFGKLARTQESIDEHLLTLQQSSGVGRLPMGLQDPRYKDRGLAAYNIATLIPGIRDMAERQRVSQNLIQILNQNVSPDETLLQAYLLMAIGQLGQVGGLDEILRRLQAGVAGVRQGAIHALLSWPDLHEARKGLPGLQAGLTDPDPAVRAVAAAALGQLASPIDTAAVESLRAAMDQADSPLTREVKWNAAVALARLHDPQGSRFVATVLLNRRVLAQTPHLSTGRQPDRLMPIAVQDRVILSTLAAAGIMTDPIIWDKIRALAHDDPSLVVRKKALHLIQDHDREAETGADDIHQRSQARVSGLRPPHGPHWKHNQFRVGSGNITG